MGLVHLMAEEEHMRSTWHNTTFLGNQANFRCVATCRISCFSTAPASSYTSYTTAADLALSTSWRQTTSAAVAASSCCMSSQRCCHAR
jgi:hypothetical protein